MDLKVDYKEESVVPEKVTFAFDPAKITDPELKAVFADSLAKIIWIGVRRDHLIGEDFNRNCLQLARFLQKPKNKAMSGKELSHWLRCYDIIGSSEEGVGEKLLPFIRGERRFVIEIKEKSSSKG